MTQSRNAADILNETRKALMGLSIDVVAMGTFVLGIREVLNDMLAQKYEKNAGLTHVQTLSSIAGVPLFAKDQKTVDEALAAIEARNNARNEQLAKLHANLTLLHGEKGANTAELDALKDQITALTEKSAMAVKAQKLLVVQTMTSGGAATKYIDIDVVGTLQKAFQSIQLQVSERYDVNQSKRDELKVDRAKPKTEVDPNGPGRAAPKV